jgi:hypothetical protein
LLSAKDSARRHLPWFSVRATQPDRQRLMRHGMFIPMYYLLHDREQTTI